MKYAILVLILGVSSAFGQDAPVQLPALHVGDAWTYRITTEKGQTWNQSRDEISITRVTSSTIYLLMKPVNSTQAAREVLASRDWSRVRDVNGKETIVNQPLSFPLSPGKTWELSYTEQKPNPAHKYERFENHFVVVGYEDIEVPAGKFHALKIESEGTWHAETDPSQTVTQGARTSEQSTTLSTQIQKTESREVSGKTYKAFWYVPNVDRWVKSVEEYYSSAGMRNERYTQELESYKLAD